MFCLETDYIMRCVTWSIREVGVASGRANDRNIPTVGDRPRAPSPSLVSVTHDAEVYHDANEEEDEDEYDDWDVRYSTCCSLSAELNK